MLQHSANHLGVSVSHRIYLIYVDFVDLQLTQHSSNLILIYEVRDMDKTRTNTCRFVGAHKTHGIGSPPPHLQL